MEKISDFKDYLQAYDSSSDDPGAFWATIATEFTWQKPWTKVLEWDFRKPEVKWFIGGKLNITENCIDRHLPMRAKQTAILWEPGDPKEPARKITYQQLHDEVCKVGNLLKAHGITKGDRVCIYMPMVPELAYAILGCARIGAVHSVVFAGFSSGSLADRINDCGCKLILTADGAYRANKKIDLKKIVDEAVDKCPSVERVIVLERTSSKPLMKNGRDFWWHDEMKKVNAVCKPEEMDAEDLLFILYTSGSTGKPKGMVHTCGGYMVYVGYTFRTVFQYDNPEGSDPKIFWCTADIGWVTGHSYILYGPLLNGATSMIFEGIPSWPDPGRFWQAIERHKVNIFYTAPTAIRSLEKEPISFVDKYDLSSLGVIGSVGEPINEEAWHWYHKHIGKEKCPLVDTWWQTETGGIMISPIAHVTKLKPSFASFPLPGVQPAIMDEKGNEISLALPFEGGIEGRLAIKFPWPSIARTIYGNHQRFAETYFSTFPGMYFTGDGCKRDEDGYYRITGRVDDIIIVSGHNMGTAEIESAIDEHPAVCESAVVGFPHDIKGQGVYAFVICHNKPVEEEKLRQEIRELVSKIIGPISKPDKIQFVSGLPKTRSGKIIRRILRKVVEGDTTNLGDTTTLTDPEVVEEIKRGALG